MRLRTLTLFVSVYAGLGIFAMAFRAPFPVNHVSITSVTPAAGSTRGGTVVAITGSGFESPADNKEHLPPSVSFVEADTGRGWGAQTVVWISSTELRAVSPPHPETLACILVTNRSPALSGAYSWCGWKYVAPRR